MVDMRDDGEVAYVCDSAHGYIIAV
jgi:hypothetical protein